VLWRFYTTVLGSGLGLVLAVAHFRWAVVPAGVRRRSAWGSCARPTTLTRAEPTARGRAATSAAQRPAGERRRVRGVHAIASTRWCHATVTRRGAPRIGRRGCGGSSNTKHAPGRVRGSTHRSPPRSRATGARWPVRARPPAPTSPAGG
jgi:hypothetical protein